MTNTDMKKKIEEVFLTHRKRDYKYHIITFTIALTLAYFCESPLNYITLHSEFLYWPFRIIHFNNERIAWSYCHLEITLLFISLYIVLHDMLDDKASLRIIALDLVITVQIILKRELEKYADERDVVNGEKPLKRKVIRPNKSFFEYFFGFKTLESKQLDDKLFI